MSNDTLHIHIGVSVAALFFSVPPFLPHYGERLNEFCEKTGLGLHLTPLWWMSVDDILSIQHRHVISYQEAWQMPITFWQWVRQLPQKPSSLFKPLLFGFPAQNKQLMYWFSKRFHHALAINACGDHSLVKMALTNWRATIKAIAQGHSICIDLRYRHSNPLTIRLSVDGLAEIIKRSPGSIKLICLDMDAAYRLTRFTLPEHSQKILEKMLEMLRDLLHKNDIPVIIEINPSPQSLIVGIKNHIHQITSPLNAS